ncbi:MAG TPA: OsmC family protein [Fulvivirga sp.]|nr:OsmC family protein [Fulvivirga sp.]
MSAHYYNVDINWSQDRKGMMSSPELNDDIEVATPPEFPKGMPNIWSPEHLFTAAVSSCLMTTFLAIAENSNLQFEDFNCQSNGKLEQVEGKFLMTQITLKPTVTITDEKDYERALRVLEKSERACLISNSIKSEIVFEPTVKISSNKSVVV